MCLDRATPILLTEDLVVYKIVTSGTHRHGANVSPYQRFQYKPNKKYNCELKFKNKTKEVNEGFHTFATKEDAFMRKDRAGACSVWYSADRTLKVVKMIIPAKATVYVGNFGYVKSYASDRIITGDLKAIRK